jgi:hypothetical protein
VNKKQYFCFILKCYLSLDPFFCKKQKSISIMKKLLTLVLFTISATIAWSQAPKYVLLEHFTNTRCGICGGTNPTFYNNVSITTNTKLHHISMHSSIPYSACVFYQANPTPQDARATYFSIPGTPRVVINGTSIIGAGSVTAASIDNAYCTNCSPVEIKVSEADNGDGTRQVQVKTKTLGTMPSGNFSLMAAVVEKTVNYAAPNGESVHRNVFRQFLTPTAGQPFMLPAQGGGQILTVFSYPLNIGIASELYVVAWLFDNTTKAVLNSGTRFDPNTIPVELTQFTGIDKNGKNQLNWATATEINTDYFDIERSTDSKNFESVGRIKAAGQSASLLTYAFEDEKSLQKINYYRLKTVDLDGTSNLSNTVTIVSNSKSSAPLKLFPTVVSNTLNLTYEADGKPNNWRIVDAFGKVVQQSLGSKKGVYTEGSLTEILDVSNFPKGLYLFQLIQESGTQVARFVKH